MKVQLFGPCIDILHAKPNCWFTVLFLFSSFCDCESQPHPFPLQEQYCNADAVLQEDKKHIYTHIFFGHYVRGLVVC